MTTEYDDDDDDDDDDDALAAAASRPRFPDSGDVTPVMMPRLRTAGDEDVTNVDGGGGATTAVDRPAGRRRPRR